MAASASGPAPKRDDPPGAIAATITEVERPAVMVRVSRDLELVELTPPEGDLAGRKLAEQVVQIHRGLGRDADRDEWGSRYREVFETGRARSFHVRFSDGERMQHMECHLQPDGTADGEVSTVVGLFTDITQQVEIHARAIESAQKLSLLLEQAPAFCYLLDRNLVFTSSVGAGLQGLGLAQDQLVGTDLYELRGTRDPEFLPIACHLKALAGEPQQYADTCMGRSLEFSLRPLRDPDGRIVGVIGIGLDVTEREQARDRQSKLLAQLRQAQKMESIGRLAGGVAHDFNNLLTCIMGNITMAARELRPHSAGRRRLVDATEAAESAAALTRQLLAFGRKQIIQPRAMNLSALLGRVDGMLRRLIGEHIRLRTVTADDLWTVMADPSQLEQALVNLVVNARDAIAGAGEITVEAANREVSNGTAGVPANLEPGQYVVLTVSDTGRGMPESVRAKLFEPFFTTKAIGEGTGLGLATVYGAVLQHGGVVDVDSELGRGTTFRVFLPRVDREPEPIFAVPDETGGRASGALSEALVGTERILLVEDDPSLLELAQCTLEQLGYAVSACCNPHEALAEVTERGQEFDLLLTDVVMPGLNGKELAGHLGPLLPRMRVLYTSGYGESIIANHGVLEAGVHFIEKPYHPASLAKKVRSVLDSDRVQAEGERGAEPGP